jgi:hypothetical protein
MILTYIQDMASLNLDRGKRLVCEADHSPPAITEVKNMWIYTSTPLYIFMA